MKTSIVAVLALLISLPLTPRLGSAQARDEPTTWKLTVSASAERRPSPRYRLDYALHEQVEGNGATVLGSALLLLPSDAAVREKMDEVLDAESLDPVAVKAALAPYASALRYAELAMQRTEFVSGTPLRQEGIAALLPSLSQVRHLSRPIALRARLEIAEGRFDDARRTLRVGYALARRHAEQHTLVEALVGVGIAAGMNSATQAWLTAPDSPNLYWALSTLRPFADGREAVRGEQSWIYFSMPGLDFSKSDHFTTDDWKRALISFFRISALSQGGGQSEAARNLQLAGLVAMQLPAARAYLKSEGMTDEQLNKLQPVEIVGRYFFGQFDQYMQDMTKWWSLPYPQAARGLERVEAAIASERSAGNLNPAMVLLPALTGARWTFTKLDRALAAMQVIESLRHHAATHDRKLPEALDDSLELPPPLDPSTGKPFGYQRTDDGFILTSPAPEGREPREALRVEVRFR